MSLRLRKAMVLAAGFGKRLRPLSVGCAKPAFPLMGRPLIEYIFRRLARAGLSEVVVNLHHHQDTVTPSLERAPKELTIHQSIEAELLGTAGGLKKVECHFASEDAFLLLNADTLVDFDLDTMMRVHRDSGALATLLLRPKPPRSPYSTVRVEANGQIDSIARGGSDGEWMFAGVWILSPKILERLSVAPGGLEKELLPGLIAERAAYASPQKPNWITIDTPTRYWSACLMMARERLFEDDWSVELVSGCGSANVWAGAGTRIEAGVEFHGDVVLGAGCYIGRGARIERTICWDQVDVPRGTRLDNCVITEGVRLRPEMELADRLVMRVAGDGSELRKRELVDGLLVAKLRSERMRGL